jgi:hypothetical protein
MNFEMIDANIIRVLNSAEHSVDIICTNEEQILGLPAFAILASIVNKNCSIRFVHSQKENPKNNYYVEERLFSFVGNCKRIYCYDNENYSSVIIDQKISYTLDLTKSNQIIEADLGQSMQYFEKIWIENSVNTIRSIYDVINDTSSLNKGEFLFRGQCNSDWHAIPSLLRDHKKEAPLIEAKYLKRLFNLQHLPYTYNYDPLAFLTVYQHYNIKTRLLDFSRDVLVALFFACYDPENKYIDSDGKLYIIEAAQFYRLNYNQNIGLFSRKPNEENRDAFFQRFHLKEHCVFEPTVKNPRMRVQDGLFMLFPFTMDDDKYISLERYTT